MDWKDKAFALFLIFAGIIGLAAGLEERLAMGDTRPDVAGAYEATR